MQCPFCLKEEPVRIKINPLDLRICPNCKASFLPVAQLTELRHTLMDTTKNHWIRVLSMHKGKFDYNKIPVCIEHGEPMEKETLPGFSVQGFVSKCCSTMHLSPDVMEQILKIVTNKNTEAVSNNNGIARFLGSFLFRILEKKHPEEDAIDRLQYDTKLRHVLEPEEQGQIPPCKEAGNA